MLRKRGLWTELGFSTKKNAGEKWVSKTVTKRK